MYSARDIRTAAVWSRWNIDIAPTLAAPLASSPSHSRCFSVFLYLIFYNSFVIAAYLSLNWNISYVHRRPCVFLTLFCNVRVLSVISECVLLNLYYFFFILYFLQVVIFLFYLRWLKPQLPGYIFCPVCSVKRRHGDSKCFILPRCKIKSNWKNLIGCFVLSFFFCVPLFPCLWWLKLVPSQRMSQKRIPEH